MLQQILKEATKNKHSILEELMFVEQIMAGILTLQQYRQILSTNYLVHKQFENKIHSLLSEENAEVLTVANRIKTASLKADLLQINVDLPQPNTYGLLPEFESEAAAFGALYVLEGATLGGNVIVKKLKTTQPFIDMGLNFYYYQVYGEKLGTYWKEFCNTLNNLPVNWQEDVVKGANKMFDQLILVQKNTMYLD